MGVAKRVAAVAVPLGLVIGGVAYGVSRHQSGDDKTIGECTTEVGGLKVILTDTQARNATLISAIAVRRGMPAHAATIGLAAALTESKLYNLRGGDRDSLGLFQQRPSQGWGTPQEILDPAHATNAFYDALERVPAYADLRVTVAAQRVQRSGYPSAYAVYEDDARALASAMTGYSPAAFWCHQATPEGSSVPAAQRARAMRAALLAGVRADQRAGGARARPFRCRCRRASRAGRSRRTSWPTRPSSASPASASAAASGPPATTPDGVAAGVREAPP